MEDNIITFATTDLPRRKLFTQASLQHVMHEMEDLVAHYYGVLHTLHDASKKLEDARYALENTKARVLIDGIEGTNAAVRDARLRILTHAEHNFVKAAEEVYNAAKRDAELANLEMTLLKAQVKAHAIAAAYDEGTAA